MIDEIVNRYAYMLDEFNKINNIKEKYNFPFPMGVFGTLRKIPEGQGNHRRMDISKYYLHKKAFVPNFSVSGLSTFFSLGASGIFELFFYDKEEWNQMIIGVDRLESFCPGQESYGYYHRTLVWAYILDDNEFNEEYNAGINLRYSLNNERRLPLLPSNWSNYKKVPAWIYSSTPENKECEQCKDKIVDTIIWYE